MPGVARAFAQLTERLARLDPRPPDCAFLVQEFVADGVELFADGGSATLDSLKVRHLRSSWATGRHEG